QKRARDRKPLVGATVHRHFARILRVWPDARFVHICRDGRDVARSCIQMGWAGNPWTAVERWTTAESEWQALRARIPPERRHEVSYERFIADAEAVLEEVCAFIGIPFDPKMFDYASDSTYERPNPKLASRWRQDMPPRDVQLVEARAGALLVACGY